MSRAYTVDTGQPENAKDAIEAAATALEAGELVVLPTETVYGIACRPDLPEATEKLFDAKGRSPTLNLPVLAPSAGEAWHVAEPTPAALALARVLWPGPLTLVLPRTQRSMPWYLGEELMTVGVRVPDLPLSLALLQRCGPLAATSANISGEPPLSGAGDLEAAFGSSVAVYLLAARGGTPSAQVPSTVVDLTGEAIRVLREGTLGHERIGEVLAGSGVSFRWLD